MKYIILLVMLFSTSAYADNWEYRNTWSIVGASNKINSCAGDCLLSANNNEAPLAYAASATYTGFDSVNIGIEGSISSNPAVLFSFGRKFGNTVIEANAGFVAQNDYYSFNDLAGKNSASSYNWFNSIVGLTVTYKDFLLRYMVTSANNIVNYSEATSFDVNGDPVYTDRTDNISSTKNIIWAGYSLSF